MMHFIFCFKDLTRVIVFSIQKQGNKYAIFTLFLSSPI